MKLTMGNGLPFVILCIEYKLKYMHTHSKNGNAGILEVETEKQEEP